MKEMGLKKRSRRGVQDEKKERELKRKTSSFQDEYNSSKYVDEEILKDQNEKEELEQHLRERDSAKTRRFAERKKVSRNSNAAKDNEDVETLRKVSRQEYLKKKGGKEITRTQGLY